MTHTVTRTGDQGLTPVRYNSPHAGTTFDLTSATFHIDNYQLDGDFNAYPFQVRTPTGAITVNGGTFVAEEHDDLTWDHIYHDQPGNSAGIFVDSLYSYTVKNASITGAWDAIRTGGSGQFLIDDVYVHGNRDDAIENDNGNAGVVRDSLFEDSFSGFSLSDGDIQQLNNKVFELDGVLMKLEDYPYEGSVVTHGPLFKLEHNSNTGGIETNPFIKINNSVLAIEKVDHEGWTRQAHAWSRQTADSANNVFLNLSDTPLPSNYPKPPAGWTILQGAEARFYWEDARADWIARHDGTDPPQPAAPTISVADKIIAEDGGNAGFVVALDHAATGPVTVNYATSNGTATAGSDFTNTSGTLTFNAGETSKTVNVPILNDTIVESSETLNFTLTSPTGATIADGSAVGTITDNDTAPPPAGRTLSVSDATPNPTVEGGVANFVVSLNGPATSQVWFNASTLAGSADAFDFSGFTNTVYGIAAGQTSVNIAVPVTADGTTEGAQNFSLVVDYVSSDDSSAITIADGTGNANIADGAGTPPPTGPMQLTISDASPNPTIEGGDAAFTFSLNKPAESQIWISLDTINGTATAGSDFTGLSGAVWGIAQGETSSTFTVETLRDSLTEGNETFRLDIPYVYVEGGQALTVLDRTGQATIGDFVV